MLGTIVFRVDKLTNLFFPEHHANTQNIVKPLDPVYGKQEPFVAVYNFRNYNCLILILKHISNNCKYE